MMAMLIRAGLPSRRAAMVAVQQGNPIFVDSAGMRQWLESNEIAALTDAGNWPTPDTAALWKRFRDEILSGGIQKIRVDEMRRSLADGQTRPENGVCRLEIEKPSGDAWICTPDHQRIAKLRSRVSDSASGLFAARFTVGDDRALVQRFGPGRARWIQDGA
jgi:hypothetical protein